MPVNLRPTLMVGAVALALSCSPAKQLPPSDPPSPRSDPAPAPSLHEPTADLLSSPSKSDRPSWSQLLDEVAKDCEEAERLFEGGEFEEGRRIFRASLKRLSESGYSFRDHAEVEQAYYRVLGKLQEWELRALAANADFSYLGDEVPPQEETPLDQMADLNLYALEVDPKIRDLVDEEFLDDSFDFPVVINNAVLRALEFYQNRGRDIMVRGIQRSGRYRELFERTFRDVGLPRDLIYMVHVESLFNPRAYSRARAKGLWQFTSGTARFKGLKIDWWIDERSDVEKSTRTAALYLKELREKFGDWYLALAAYNVGPGRVQRALRRHGRMDYWKLSKRRLIPRETRNFVPSILASILIFHNPKHFGFDAQPEPAWRTDEVPLTEQVELGVVAELLELSEERIRELNPELRRGLTPFALSDYRLKVPQGRGAELRQKLAELPPSRKTRFLHHQVRPGETLGLISRRYGAPLQAIAQVNRIRNVHRLSVGQDLMIPISGSRSSRPMSRSLAASSARHIVRRGDTLARISRVYGVPLRSILRWNGLKKSSTIFPGQSIRLTAPASN